MKYHPHVAGKTPKVLRSNSRTEGNCFGEFT